MSSVSSEAGRPVLLRRLRNLVHANMLRAETMIDTIEAFGVSDAARIYADRASGRQRHFKGRIGSVPVVIRSATPDLNVALESLGPEFAALGATLSDDFDGLIVDAGGYIGTVAIKFAQMFPRARVVTIEPSSRNFGVLARNVRDFPGITPLNLALHTESGARLHLRTSAGIREWGYTVVERDGDEAIEEVGTISLADVFASYGEGREVGMVKLDIEGAERALFERCAADLARARVVVAELHDRRVPGCTAAFQAFSRDRTILSLPGEKLVSLR